MDSKKSRIFLAILLLVFTMLACNFGAQTATPELPLTEGEVPRIPLEQAKVALEGGAAIVVDVRSTQAYEQSHIAGAINIPLGEIETNPNGLELDKDQWIITYCT